MKKAYLLLYLTLSFSINTFTGESHLSQSEEQKEKEREFMQKLVAEKEADLSVDDITIAFHARRVNQLLDGYYEGLRRDKLGAVYPDRK